MKHRPIDDDSAPGHSGGRAWSRPVTICIAAICHDPSGAPYIIGATDRKITAGDIQYEPGTAVKIWDLGHSMAAMIAGESDAQAEICNRLTENRPKTVRGAVSAYAASLAAYTLER